MKPKKEIAVFTEELLASLEHDERPDAQFQEEEKESLALSRALSHVRSPDAILAGIDRDRRSRVPVHLRRAFDPLGFAWARLPVKQP